MTYSVVGNTIISFNANADISFALANISILPQFTGNLTSNTMPAAQAQLPVGFIITQSGFQGTVAGFNAGGACAGNTPIATIQRYGYFSGSSTSTIGNLSTPRSSISGQSSTSHGYNSGGTRHATCYNFGGIDKFPFAAGGTASTTTSLSQARYATAGHSSSTAGYASGGYCVFTTNLSRIDKFSFSTDTTVNCIGALTSAKANESVGISSSISGYSAGGNCNSGTLPQSLGSIEKFPFATDSSAISVGNILCRRSTNGGISSTTHGYNAGGLTDYAPSGAKTVIDKFPYSSENLCFLVGDLIQARGSSGSSSTEHGYVAGGYIPSGSFAVTTIDRFPFATDSSASFFGSLVCCVNGFSSTQD